MSYNVLFKIKKVLMMISLIFKAYQEFIQKSVHFKIELTLLFLNNKTTSICYLDKYCWFFVILNQWQFFEKWIIDV